jgi:hypothetical protein
MKIRYGMLAGGAAGALLLVCGLATAGDSKTTPAAGCSMKNPQGGVAGLITLNHSGSVSCALVRDSLSASLTDVWFSVDEKATTSESIGCAAWSVASTPGGGLDFSGSVATTGPGYTVLHLDSSDLMAWSNGAYTAQCIGGRNDQIHGFKWRED